MPFAPPERLLLGAVLHDATLAKGLKLLFCTSFFHPRAQLSTHSCPEVNALARSVDFEKKVFLRLYLHQQLQCVA